MLAKRVRMSTGTLKVLTGYERYYNTSTVSSVFTETGTIDANLVMNLQNVFKIQATFVAFDFGTMKEFAQIGYTNADSNGPTSIKIQKSNDNSSWVDVGTYSVNSSGDSVTFAPQKARYLKVIALNGVWRLCNLWPYYPVYA